MENVTEYFGCMEFDDRVMKACLSGDVYCSLKKTIDEGVNCAPSRTRLKRLQPKNTGFIQAMANCCSV